MEVLILLVFVSLVLVVGAVAFFAWNIAEGTHQHADRLALLPLDDEDDRDTGARTGVDGTTPAVSGSERSRRDSDDVGNGPRQGRRTRGGAVAASGRRPTSR